MSKKISLHFILLPFGIALLFAGLFFQKGAADSINLQVTPVPTQDRLAEPTLPASPSQADYGAQVYWLNCSACHGDKAQGLTDEFRSQYPPEDQNCWKSHCHGKITYENGFTIPTVVPQLVGSGSLAKFPTAANLYGFVHAAMPFQRPNSLTDEQYYQVVSFLLRENALIDPQTEVNASNAAKIAVSRATPTPVVTPQQTEVQNGNGAFLWFLLMGIIVALALIFVLKKSRNTTTI
ncbi:MAG TPA: c-type cytochrome [Anaerolineales bacterium]|nr:c-type cytochrome [Anaerolineales bacterium]